MIASTLKFKNYLDQLAERNEALYIKPLDIEIDVGANRLLLLVSLWRYIKDKTITLWDESVLDKEPSLDPHHLLEGLKAYESANGRSPYPMFIFGDRKAELEAILEQYGAPKFVKIDNCWHLNGKYMFRSESKIRNILTAFECSIIVLTKSKIIIYLSHLPAGYSLKPPLFRNWFEIYHVYQQVPSITPKEIVMICALCKMDEKKRQFVIKHLNTPLIKSFCDLVLDNRTRIIDWQQENINFSELLNSKSRDACLKLPYKIACKLYLANQGGRF